MHQLTQKLQLISPSPSICSQSTFCYVLTVIDLSFSPKWGCMSYANDEIFGVFALLLEFDA